MRIAIDMLMVEQEQSGIFCSTLCLLEELTQLDDEHEYIIITARPQEYHLQKRVRQRVRLYVVNMHAWQGMLIQHQLLLTGILRRLCPDILHVIDAVAPIGWSGPLIITIHDLIYLDERYLASSLHALLYWRRIVKESMARAQVIFTGSAHVQSELHQRWSIDIERVNIVSQTTQAQATLAAYQQIGHPDHTQWTSTPGMLADKHAYPTVSVIMPASRLDKAEQALAALDQQTYRGQIETFVVGPPAKELATRWPIHVVHQETLHRPARARNLGAAQASGDVFIFLDDDMIVDEHWVEQNIAALEQPGVGIVGARMPGKAQTFFARCADFTNYGHYQHHYCRQESLGAGSMGLYKDLFCKLGGFDETLQTSEDIDLCYRAQQQGYSTLYTPDIVVIHDHQYDTLRKLLRYNYRHGLHGGLEMQRRYYRSGLKKWLVAIQLSFPPFFLCILPCAALIGTLRIVALNVGKHKEVLLYIPYILLGKLVYQLGIFVHLLRRVRHHA